MRTARTPSGRTSSTRPARKRRLSTTLRHPLLCGGRWRAQQRSEVRRDWTMTTMMLWLRLRVQCYLPPFPCFVVIRLATRGPVRSSRSVGCWLANQRRQRDHGRVVVVCCSLCVASLSVALWIGGDRAAVVVVVVILHRPISSRTSLAAAAVVVGCGPSASAVPSASSSSHRHCLMASGSISRRCSVGRLLAGKSKDDDAAADPLPPCCCCYSPQADHLPHVAAAAAQRWDV